MTSSVQILDQGVGYGILVGVGALFATFIAVITKLMNRYLHENSNSTEMFMVANRSVGIGLTGSAVLSSWLWATVILWSVVMVYNYGIGSAYLYAATSSVQIAILTVIGIEAKLKIPHAHTSLEIIQLRYGKYTHILYIFLCLVNNLLSCASMILGASSAIVAMCGIHVVAANLLLPFGVICYTVVGGLKSTFLTDYIHTVIALIVFIYFATAALTNEEIGGIGSLYRKVRDWELENNHNISGNYEGSLLTMKSQGAWFFGLIHSIGDTGLSVMDSSFWQKAYSADVNAMVPGYIIGSLTIYACAWPIGTIFGLIAVILEDTSIFPTYPNKMTTDDIDSGYVIIYTLKALLGKNAVAALALCIFLAATSTVSAQTISVSSIISFDIYRTYINPKATDKQLIAISHFGVIFFGLFCAGFSIMLNYVGVNITWMGYFYSMVICPGVIPLIASIIWKDQNLPGVFISPIIGMGAGLGVWLGTAKKMYGALNLDTTVEQLPCLYGSLTALFLPGILTVIISLVKPANFDWNILKKATLVEDNDQFSENPENSSSGQSDFENPDFEKQDSDVSKQPLAHVGSVSAVEENKKKKLKKMIRIAWIYCIANILITQVVWPLPLYRDYIFTESFFKGWVGVSVAVIYASFIVVGIYPLWDGRNAIKKVIFGVYRDLSKKKV
ncbi:hypothetical protein PACTADRAFT_39464 [Pachysolen tannophilus NRRL Y-2460]|uniref:Urea active transporter n=1 Tax=Pachysolen tannophilus NRRL Y-2460 TaxID=669874 RepID=A0A1E4TXY4_PACTA|nr:hypothetical protein PACTADRAFT_39464 [Pachysolen tannophilus NRRL Y-2460]